MFRMAALLPVVLGLLIAFAPASVSDRFYSVLSLKDAYGDSVTSTSTVQSNRDRLAMIKSGFRIVRDNPLTGVGPDMVIQVYPGYLEPTAVSQRNSHLHNVPCRSPRSAGFRRWRIWCWFVATLLTDFLRCADVAAAIARGGAASPASSRCWLPGMFEYNFGDSEFLMLFLVIITLPYAAERVPAPVVERRPLDVRLSGLRPVARPNRGTSILVIGDLMVDQFVIGTVDRISPEAPVPIVRFDHETWRLGGAANVAHNVVALGGRVDADRRCRQRSDGARPRTNSPDVRSAPPASSAIASRCTTRKLRVVTTRNQQVARIDYESDAEIDPAIEASGHPENRRAGGFGARNRRFPTT